MHGAGLCTEVVASLPYETPFFVFSQKKLEDNLAAFETAFSGSTVHYALKANSEPAIIETLAVAGSSFEAASLGELHLLQEAGVPPDRIVYGTSVKPGAQIEAFAAYGVDRFAFDCPAELEKIAVRAPGARVYARIAVDDAGSVFRFSEKFGTSPHNAAQLLIEARDRGIVPYGVSFHVGSQCRNARAWASGLVAAGDVMRLLEPESIVLHAVNIGGGFPCRYAADACVPTLVEIAGMARDALESLPYRPKILLEPGRGIVADAGVVVASVIARVRRPDRTWLFLDAGVYNALFEAMAYQGSTRYPIESVRQCGREELFAIAGPTGDSPDIITREARLPADIDVGDRLVIRNAGAYTVSVTSRFNGFAKPMVYLQ